MQQFLTPNTWHPRARMCAESTIYGAGICVESELQREYYHEEYPLYYFLGYTNLGVKVVPGMCNKSRLIEEISQSEHCTVFFFFTLF